VSYSVVFKNIAHNPLHFSRKDIKVFDENIPGFSPFNGLQWETNGSRSKWEFQCSFKGL